jgi:hypothetical protein
LDALSSARSMASKPSNSGEFKPTARTMIEALPALHRKAFIGSASPLTQHRADVEVSLKSFTAGNRRYGCAAALFKAVLRPD